MLADERCNLVDERALVLSFGERFQRRDGIPRGASDILVVVEVRAVPFDDRVRLMDVLLPHQRGDAMSRVLRVIETTDLGIGSIELAGCP